MASVTSLVRKKIFTPKSSLVRNERLWAYLFIAPGIISVLIFSLISILASIGISFTDWRLLKAPQFVGLDNYARLFTDPVFPKALINTGIYTLIGVPVGVFLALLMAMALNQKIKGVTFFRVAYYLPVISASVAVSMVWMWIFSTDYGVLNYLLGLFGVAPVNWLNDTRTVLLSVTAVSIWRDLGLKIILLLAALQDVPEELIEAATIDGAKWWQRFKKVVVPLISPTIFYVTVTGFIGAIQSFDLVYNMRFDHDGGPARATTTIAFYIWQVAFDYLKMGYGTAMAIVLFVFIMVITYIQWRARRWFVYAEE